MQRLFSKFSIFALVPGLAVIGAQALLEAGRPGLNLAPATVSVDWQSVAVPRLADPRVRVAGAWRLRSEDRRVGGISGLALDRGRLLALSDSGMLIALDRPGTPNAAARIRPLPEVAGDPSRKIGRDSEALVRDRQGRGWWVAFEQRHELILYDRSFSRVLARVRVTKPRFRDNHGIEALSDTGEVTWYAESTGISDAARLPDGREVWLMRWIGATGFRAALEGLGAPPIALPIGVLDNAEAIAAERRPDGGTRLWIMTDNDFRRRRPTLVLAVDLAPGS